MKQHVAANAIAGTVIVLIAALTQAAAFEMTPAAQGELDKAKVVLAKWAASPAVVNAVKEQNAKGPIPGLDNAKWKTMRRTDPVVKGFETNAAGQFLKARMDEHKNVINKVFLNAAKGEKVAFGEKTISYLHAGDPKFDVPYGTGKAWQGKPWFDESIQTYAIQVSVPVLSDGHAIGVLVGSVSLSYLESVSRK